jgi:hypothetical protein
MSIIKIGKYKIRSDVYQAIQEASNKYNVPFSYMLAMAAKESNFDPNAKATTSSATGLYQFIKRTWDDMWKDSKVKPLPTDVFANADAGARYAKQIQNKLKTNDPASLYLGHFLGVSGANDLLTLFNKDPNILADTIVSENVLKANRSVFYHKDGVSKTIGEIYDWSKNSIDKIISNLGV